MMMMMMIETIICPIWESPRLIIVIFSYSSYFFLHNIADPIARMFIFHEGTFRLLFVFIFQYFISMYIFSKRRKKN